MTSVRRERPATKRTAVLDFAGLPIEYDATVLVPRAWTLAQSRWAQERLQVLPEGAVLELCAGVGHIGLAAVQESDRPLVMVDRDARACELAVSNARALGGRAAVRQASLAQAVNEEERFVLVIADPPWVPSRDVGLYPADPLGAIDGGHDGLDVARDCLRVASRHLLAGGEILLQIGTTAQLDLLREAVGQEGLEVAEVRSFERGVLVRLLPVRSAGR